MRLAFALLSVLAVATPAAATTAFTDPAGDVETTLGGQVIESRPDQVGHIDLLGLEVEELPEGFVFRVRVADLSAGVDETSSESGSYPIAFALGEQQFRLTLYRGNALPPYYGASLLALRGDEWTWLWSRDSTIADEPNGDVQANEIFVFVDRRDLRFPDGRLPGPGDAITVAPVVANLTGPDGHVLLGVGEPGLPYFAHDAMPDDGQGATVPVRLGVARDGDPVLEPLDPFRSSNGAATTYVFPLNATNLGDIQRPFSFAAEGVPDGWTVQAPSRVDLAPGETRLVEAVVQVPFFHQHGTAQWFTLAMTGSDGHGRHGALLGVRFTAIPQPAGHHDVLSLHSHVTAYGKLQEATERLLGPGTWTPLSMNTDPEDPADAGLEVPPMAGDDAAARHYRWYAELTPRLAIGLDFGTENGLLSLPLRSDLPVLGGSLHGRLVLQGAAGGAPSDQRPYWGEPVLDLARLQLDAIDLAAGAAETIAVPIMPLLDRLPFERGTRLWLDLVLEVPVAPGLAPAAPRILPGGLLKLPLQEYSEGPELAAGQAAGSEPSAAPRDAGAAQSPMPVWLAFVGLALAGRRR